MVSERGTEKNNLNFLGMISGPETRKCLSILYSVEDYYEVIRNVLNDSMERLIILKRQQSNGDVSWIKFQMAYAKRNNDENQTKPRKRTQCSSRPGKFAGVSPTSQGLYVHFFCVICIANAQTIWSRDQFSCLRLHFWPDVFEPLFFWLWWPSAIEE